MAPRRIVGIFAHPDDETSSCAGVFTQSAAQGAHVTVVTATRGEKGALGSGGLVIKREDLPRVREEEQRAVAGMIGVKDVVYLGYIDGEVKDVPLLELMGKLMGVMDRLQPDLVITFGPLGVSRHDDHIAIHEAATEAFHRHVAGRPDPNAVRLYYVAIPKDIADRFEMNLTGVEVNPNVVIDISAQRAAKVQALRSYRSQEDAQMLAGMFEQYPDLSESFYQAYPPVPNGAVRTSLW